MRTFGFGVLSAWLLGACSAAGTPHDAGPDAAAPAIEAGSPADVGPAPTDGAAAPRPALRGEGLQEDGTLSVFRPRARTAARVVLALAEGDASAPDAPAAAPPGQGPGEWIEVSAPILPDLKVLYAAQGDAYPASQEAREDVAHRASLLFEQLLDLCAASDPRIKLRQPGDPPLTGDEMRTNYAAVAECSYNRFTSKPYWIPQLVSDVDICGRELGPGWALITQADVERLSEPEFLLMREALGGNPSDFWGAFYFQLRVFVRAADGSIQEGRFDPRQTPRVVPLQYPQNWTSRDHYEGGLALRCLRRTEVIE
jgi:hypothetical protein